MVTQDFCALYLLEYKYIIMECFSSQLGIVVHRMFDIVYTNMSGFTKKEIIFFFWTNYVNITV